MSRVGPHAPEHPSVALDRGDGGQQQRVAIVRALAMRPEVMLLDEITSSLDPELVGEVLDVVRELKSEGMTMLIATHEMAFAREIADRVCFLHDGVLLESGRPNELFDRPQQERTTPVPGQGHPGHGALTALTPAMPRGSVMACTRDLANISSPARALPWRCSLSPLQGAADPTMPLPTTRRRTRVRRRPS